MTSLSATMVRQFGNPHGTLGRLAGWIMAHRESNRERNRWTVDLLCLQPADRVLEIGYGPGLAIAYAAERASRGQVVGLDHSRLMQSQASARNAQAIRAGRVDLRLGGFAALADLPGQFDKVFAVNVFQFLPDRPQALRALRSVMNAGALLAVTYMPRRVNAASGGTEEFAARMRAEMAEAGFGDVRVATLDLKPTPAVCVLGRRGIGP
jgi:trans-aconitate methyltransferase